MSTDIDLAAAVEDSRAAAWELVATVRDAEAAIRVLDSHDPCLMAVHLAWQVRALLTRAGMPLPTPLDPL